MLIDNPFSKLGKLFNTSKAHKQNLANPSLPPVPNNIKDQTVHSPTPIADPYVLGFVNMAPICDVIFKSKSSPVSKRAAVNSSDANSSRTVEKLATEVNQLRAELHASAGRQQKLNDQLVAAEATVKVFKEEIEQLHIARLTQSTEMDKEVPMPSPPPPPLPGPNSVDRPLQSKRPLPPKPVHVNQPGPLLFTPAHLVAGFNQLKPPAPQEKMPIVDTQPDLLNDIKQKRRSQLRHVIPEEKIIVKAPVDPDSYTSVLYATLQKMRDNLREDEVDAEADSDWSDDEVETTKRRNRNRYSPMPQIG